MIGVRANAAGDHRGAYEVTCDDAARASFSRYVSESYFTTESATNVHTLTPEALRKGIDPKNLFAGPQDRAYRWASQELRDWWRQHGRVTLEEYRVELLGERLAAQNIRVARPIPEMGGCAVGPGNPADLAVCRSE